MKSLRSFFALFFILILAATRTPSFAAGQSAPDRQLFDFETESELKSWAPIDSPNSNTKEPRATLALSTTAATSGTHSLQITFAGGQWPTVGTSALPVTDWTPYNALTLDITAPRQAIIGIRARTDKDDPKDNATRFEKTCFLHQGANNLVIPIKSTAKFSATNLVALEIYMYKPAAGESLYVDNIRVANVKFPPDPTTLFTVLGTDITAKDPADLTAKLKDKLPAKPEIATVEEAETAFKKRLDELKPAHPAAILAIFRDGEKGVDPANPDKVYTGWKDATIFSHPPDANIEQRSRNYSNRPETQMYGRNIGNRLLQADLSVIPNGSTILAAELMLVRHASGFKAADDNDHYLPSVWVAEACNRDWNEKEINDYQYAEGKLWKERSGACWSGDDPDFLPIYLAYGPSAGKSQVNTWDFTEAVKFWTEGKHKNHGFGFHGPYTQDFWRRTPTRLAPNVKDRPAIMVIYEPKPQ